MSNDNFDYVELHLGDGTTITCILKEVFNLDGNVYALLVRKDDDTEATIMSVRKYGDEYMLSAISDKDEFELVSDYVRLNFVDDLTNTDMFAILNNETYQHHPYKTEDLGEDMAVVNESMGDWWKPRYLLNRKAKCAYRFIDREQRLLTVTEDDVDWESLRGLPQKAIDRALALSFHFPSFIRGFKNGVAEVCWELNPDGRYFMDDNGFGMTNDEEIDIYGFIDKNANVVVKFKNINGNFKELDKMRKQAEKAVKKRK